MILNGDSSAIWGRLTGGKTEKKGETGQELVRAHGLGIEDGRAKFYIRVAFSVMKVLHSLPAIAGALFLFSCQTLATEAQADASETPVAISPTAWTAATKKRCTSTMFAS